MDDKRPVTAIAGPFGHPFHPILVTIPIGAWVCAAVFDVASHLGGDTPMLTQGANWLIGIGVLGALLAAGLGFLDLLTIPGGTPAFRTALVHMSLNLVVIALFSLAFVLRNGRGDATDGTPAGLIALSAVGLVLLAVAGWLGGRLTYRYGVRVVRDSSHEMDH